MKKGIAALGVLIVGGAVAFVSYKQGWIFAPVLTVELTAATPSGEPLYGAKVEAAGAVQGETNIDGKLSFGFRRGAGEEMTVSATFDRPGLRFKPWQQSVVVRKWDRASPETLRYRLDAMLEPLSLSSEIHVEADGEPRAGAAVSVDGKVLGETDASGQLTVDLGTEMSRSAEVSVNLKGYEAWKQSSILRASDRLNVTLSKIGVVEGTVLVGYESMGRLVPVVDAEVKLAGHSLGATDNAGLLKFPSPESRSSLEVSKAGFVPDRATVSVAARSKSRVVVPLFPEEGPVYRIVVLPPKSARPGDQEIDSALPEIEDRLSDYLFAQVCFQKVEPSAFLQAMATARISEDKLLAKGWAGTRLSALADAVVSVVATKDSELIVSVEVISAKGDRLGGFAERGKRSRVRSLCEGVAEKIKEIFPFEGHVKGRDGVLAVTSLGSGLDRGVRKGDAVAVFRWDSSVPPVLKPLGRAVVKVVDEKSSKVEPVAKDGQLRVGDKLVLLPRNKEAALSAAVAFTVKAGRQGAEEPFPDVNVYRDGTWVGTTSDAGALRVPVAAGERHEFLFVRGGMRPYRETVSVDQKLLEKTVILPETTSRLRIESEPSAARVFLDSKPMGMTPFDVEVAMGFLHLKVDAGEDWRAFDEVLEITSPEEDLTGRRRIVLRKDSLKQAEALLAKGDISGGIALLAQVGPEHPDYSAARNRLGGVYLDVKKDPAKAIVEFEKVLERPENKELVDKRFAVTYLNLGRAYYLTATPDGSERAIPLLLKALENKRFFPPERFERASHDTLYFLALASHKLYYARPSDKRLREAERRWRDYFDFFPEELQKDEDVQRARTGAEHFYEEVKRKLAVTSS